MDCTFRVPRMVARVCSHGDFDDDCSLPCGTSSARPPFDAISHTVLWPRTCVYLLSYPASTLTRIPSSRPLRPGPIGRLSGSAKRFISSFRGRTVHGVEVSLPKGCIGLVLRGDAEGQTQMTTSSEAKRRPGRMLRRQVPEDVPEDDDMEGILPPEEDRFQKPSARFDSFVLWHSDIPVDEEMDEYLQSLSEWVNIASEVRLLQSMSLRSPSLSAQMLPSKRVCKPFPRGERYLLHPTILYNVKQSSLRHLMGETSGKSGKLEQRVENLLGDVARRLLRRIRLLDGWNALCKWHV